MFITNLCFENYRTKDRPRKRYDGSMLPHSFPFWYYHTKDRSPKEYDGPMVPHSFLYWYHHTKDWSRRRYDGPMSPYSFLYWHWSRALFHRFTVHFTVVFRRTFKKKHLSDVERRYIRRMEQCNILSMEKSLNLTRNRVKKFLVMRGAILRNHPNSVQGLEG